MQRPTLPVAIAAIAVVVAGAGPAFLATAHPLGDHNPNQTQFSEAHTGHIPGPGDPDGGGGTLPYIYQSEVVPVTQCQAVFLGTCHVGGATWDACDSPDHARNGGPPADDLPCSDAAPYDHISVSYTCVTCVVPRSIPLRLATDSGDSDDLHGEGVGDDPGNDGTDPLDGGPGPREMDVEFCSSIQGVTRPTSDEWGTGDGVVTQDGEDYMTHALGTNSNIVDSGDTIAPHPGVHSLTVYVLGPIHGNTACPSASPIPAERGLITVTLS